MHKKVVTYDKLSKKKKKEIDKRKRLGWGKVKPGTVTLKSKREYDRRKFKQSTRKETEQEI